MLIYAVTSQKGGVGKTTTTANLGAALVAQGQRVLVLDLDPQASLGAALGRHSAPVTVSDVLRAPDRILDAILPCAGGLHIVTSAATLAGVLIELGDIPSAPYQLRKALALVADRYDYCLIDCPPSLGHATTNALTAARVALVPLQCEFLSLRGLADVQEIATAIRETTNPDLRMRVVATMFDKRTIHANDVLREARSALPGLVYETVVPRTVRLAEAPAMGQTIMEYAPESNGTYAYLALAREVTEEESGVGTTERHTRGHTEPAYARQAA